MKAKTKQGSSKKSAEGRAIAFVHEYLRNGQNATQAAITVGYSEKSAAFYGCQFLKQPKIQDILKTAAEKASIASGLTVEKTLREVARIAFFDPRKVFTDSGDIKAIKDLDDDVAAVISSVEVNAIIDKQGEFQGYAKKIRFWNKNAALDSAMKHLDLFASDKLDVTLSVEQVDEMRHANLSKTLKRLGIKNA